MTYTVKSGDTLSTVARDVLGDMNLWPYLASINKITSPYIIRPGQVLIVDVAEVNAKKWPRGLIIGGVALAIAAGIYFRKNIIAFFKK